MALSLILLTQALEINSMTVKYILTHYLSDKQPF
ncbi:MAG: hypothetical protein ACI8Y3_000165 [Paraglaciecola sp.]